MIVQKRQEARALRRGHGVHATEGTGRAGVLGLERHQAALGDVSERVRHVGGHSKIVHFVCLN
eukprot:446384-Prorocentrum_minimum.AAC.2